MQIFKYLKFIVPTILFFIVLNVFFNSFGTSLYPSLAIFLITMWSAFWITKYKPLPVLLSFILSGSIILFFITLGSKNTQDAYMVFSSFLFLISLIGMNKFFSDGSGDRPTAENKIRILDSGFSLNQSMIIYSVFLFSSGIYGVYIDFGLPIWQLMLVIFIGIFFSTYYLININFIKSMELGLHLDSAKNKTFILYSFLFAFMISELIWSLSFWPSNQLTVGAIILISYYSAWNVLKSYLRNELTRTVIISNVLLFVVLNIIIISTSKWDILATI